MLFHGNLRRVYLKSRTSRRNNETTNDKVFNVKSDTPDVARRKRLMKPFPV